jgi:hypothetical protein
MAEDSDRTGIQLFISFRNSVTTGTWARLAKGLLDSKFAVHDYRDKPETGPDLLKALRNRISRSDVFIALLSKGYYENPLTRGELESAIAASTGSKDGSLRSAQRRPLVYIVTCDAWAEDWVQKNHPEFTYHLLKQYKFQVVRPDGFVPVQPELWDDWLDGIQARLPEYPPASEVAPPSGTTPVASSNLLVLGRPTGTFSPSISGARDQFLAQLGDDIPRSSIPDGWHDRRNTTTCQDLKVIAEGGPRSLLIAPCDATLRTDNQIEGDPFGSDLRTKLQQTGLSRRLAQVVLDRTWFWVPAQRDVLDEFEKSGVAVPEITDANVAAAGTLFGSAPPDALAGWLRERLGNPALVLKAEDGIRDISRKLKHDLKPYFDPLLFEVVEPDDLPLAIRQAAAEGSPVLVVIHDRKIEDLSPNREAQIRMRIHRRASDFDRMIERELTPEHRVARAILLIRHADLFKREKAILAEEEWTLLPLAREQGGFTLPPDRLQELRNSLWH